MPAYRVSSFVNLCFVPQAKLDEMEKSVANPDVGSDLRGVKELLKRHQGLENDLLTLDDQIKSIVSQGQALADAGHFDRAGILKAVDQFNKRWVVYTMKSLCSVEHSFLCPGIYMIGGI